MIEFILTSKKAQPLSAQQSDWGYIRQIPKCAALKKKKPYPQEGNKRRSCVLKS